MDEPGGGRRGPYRKGVETRAKIVDAAIGVFGRHGYRGGTLQLVASETGVTPSAIVRLFGSKQDLLLAVVQEWDARVSLAVASDAHGIDFLRQLPRAMSRRVDDRGLLELHVALSAEAGDPHHPAHEHMVARYARVHDHVAAEIVQAAADGQIDPLDDDEAELGARSLIAVMDGLEIQWLLDPSIEVYPSFVFHVDQLLLRLGAREASLN